MKKFEKFLFFYSIIAITVFFITSAFFYPTPQNLISGVLFSPIIFYFWIRLTNPNNVDITQWSLRLLIIIAILSGLGTFGYWLKEKKPAPVVEKKEEVNSNETTKKIDELTNKINELKNGDTSGEQISEELIKIKEELAKLRLYEQSKDLDVPYESLSEILSATESSQKTNKITGKSGITSINAYAEPAYSSRILEKLPPDKEYVFYDTQDGWYKIILSSDESAWISSKDVEEIQ